MSENPKQLAKPEERLIEVRVEAYPPHWAYGHSRDLERTAKSLEEWARELEEFIRDHRSQDSVGLNIVRDVQKVCSLCGRPWEVMLPDGDCSYTTCAWCGEEIEED